MNEWLKKVLGKIKDLWSKWKPIQKVIFFGIIAAIIVAIVVAASVTSKPSKSLLFSAPITEENLRVEILDRIDKENLNAEIDANGFIYVDNDNTAVRLRTILEMENLTPSNVNIWDTLGNRSWSETDDDRNVKIAEVKRRVIERHLQTLADIDMADVQVVQPKKEIFSRQQVPPSASVIIKVKNGSDLLENKKKIKGIERIVLNNVPGITHEYLVITDIDNNVLNDFESMAASDALDVVAKGRKLIQREETRIRAEVLKLFQNTYKVDRARDMRIAVEMDFSKKSSEATEYSPIQIKADNPDTPYDDSEYRDVLPISQQTVTNEWQGTGYNPEGPAGVEGQTPPVYSDMSNVIGKSVQTGVTQNNVVNTKQISEETAPTINKISVALNLDGKWEFPSSIDESLPDEVKKRMRVVSYKDKATKTKKIYVMDDKNIIRNYIPISDAEKKDAENLIKGAIGYNRNRGDIVTVTNIAYDRDDEFRELEGEILAREQRNKAILIILGAVVVVLIGFIMFKLISREIERRRRQREQELLEAQRRRTEEQLWNAKDDEQVVSMSVEESRRLELQENAIAMAKEHPEDVAMLIRTWLMEE